MNAVGVVIVYELSQFPRQVHRGPEKRPIQVLTSNGADQALNEVMRNWGVRHRYQGTMLP
jgi:hypothetical protein